MCIHKHKGVDQVISKHLRYLRHQDVQTLWNFCGAGGGGGYMRYVVYDLSTEELHLLPKLISADLWYFRIVYIFFSSKCEFDYVEEDS